MNCERCNGLMVVEHVYDMLDTEIAGQLMRCICCGAMVDPVILANKRRQASESGMACVDEARLATNAA